MTALFDLPFVSAALFVIAGVFIGHLFWYRDRSADTKKMSGLENRYVQARGSATQRKREFAKLQKTTEGQQAGLQQAGEERDVLIHEKTLLEDANRELAAKLVQLQSDKQEVEEILSSEQSRNESLVGQTQEALQLKTNVERNLDCEVSNLSQLQASHSQLENKIDSLQSNLTLQVETTEHDHSTIVSLQDEILQKSDSIGSLQNDNNKLTNEITELTQSLQARTDEANRATSENEQTSATLRDEVARLEGEILAADESLKQTQHDLVARCEDLDAIRDAQDATQEELSEASGRIAQLDTELLLTEGTKAERDTYAADLEVAATTLTAQREQLESRDTQITDLNEQAHALQQELLVANNQIDEHQTDKNVLVASIVEGEGTNKELQSEIESLSVQVEQKRAIVTQQATDIGTLSDRIAALEHETEQIAILENQIQRGKEECARIDGESESRRDAIATLEGELDALRTQVSQLDQTKTELELMSKELVTVSNERDSLTKTRVQSEETTQGLRNEVKSYTAKVKEISELLSAKTLEHSQRDGELQKQIETEVAAGEVVRQQLTAKTSQHSKAIEEISGITKTLDNRETSIQKLTAELTTLEKLKPANQGLQDRIAELTAHLRRLSGELEDSLEANADSQGRMRDLENQLHDHTVKIRDLRRQRGSLPSFGDEDTGEAVERRAA